MGARYYKIEPFAITLGPSFINLNNLLTKKFLKCIDPPRILGVFTNDCFQISYLAFVLIH